MINKRSLWFLTLFSLILVLGIYYVTMPNEIFESDIKEPEVSKKSTKEVNKENTSYIETLKIELDSERAELLNTLQAVINDKNKTTDEKNKAYEEMKNINNIKAKEEELTSKIKEEYKLDSYVKQDDTNIEVVIDSKEHDVKLANNIMRTVQAEYEDPMTISVKFS